MGSFSFPQFRKMLSLKDKRSGMYGRYDVANDVKADLAIIAKKQHNNMVWEHQKIFLSALAALVFMVVCWSFWTQCSARPVWDQRQYSNQVCGMQERPNLNNYIGDQFGTGMTRVVWEATKPESLRQ